MSHCLSEYTLVMLYIGEGAEEERTHLAGCGDCAERYQHLAHDCQRIKHLFHAAPPPHATVHSFSVPMYRWVHVAAAMAVVIVLVTVGSRWWQQSAAPVVADAVPREEVVQLVETTVVPALFANEPLPGVVLPIPVSNETYIQAALEGEWPCEQDESTSPLNCGIHTFPLLIGG